MRIVLSPVAVVALRLATAFAGGVALVAGFEGDHRYDPWAIGMAVGFFGLTAFLMLPDFLMRRKRQESGVVDLRAVLRSVDFWGPLATLLLLTILVRLNGWTGRFLLAITSSAMLFGWAQIGRRALWVEAPSILRWPVRDERDLVDP